MKTHFINFTDKALNDYEKIFGHSINDNINTYTPKFNHHKAKKENRKKEVIRRARTNYPVYLFENEQIEKDNNYHDRFCEKYIAVNKHKTSLALDNSILDKTSKSTQKLKNYSGKKGLYSQRKVYDIFSKNSTNLITQTLFSYIISVDNRYVMSIFTAFPVNELEEQQSLLKVSDLISLMKMNKNNIILIKYIKLYQYSKYKFIHWGIIPETIISNTNSFDLFIDNPIRILFYNSDKKRLVNKNKPKEKVSKRVIKEVLANRYLMKTNKKDKKNRSKIKQELKNISNNINIYFKRETYNNDRLNILLGKEEPVEFLSCTCQDCLLYYPVVEDFWKVNIDSYYLLENIEIDIENLSNHYFEEIIEY